MTRRYTQGWLCGLAAVALVASAACERNNTRPAAQASNTPGQAAPADTHNPDWWTTTKVQAQFFADDAVRGRDIHVATHDGVVTLTGTVDTDTAKNRAEALARGVDGVSSVNDQLVVRAATNAANTRDTGSPNATVATSGRSAAMNPIEAGWITTKIQAQYFADRDIKPWNIDVTTTSDGRVTLDGTVDSAAKRAKAEGIARNTEGVTGVDNRLRVKGAATHTPEAGAPAATAIQPVKPLPHPNGIDTDAWITTKVRARFFTDPDIKNMNVDVTTDDGVVTLAGTVRDEAAKAAAERIAGQIDGVKRVENRLTVGGTP